MKLHKIAVLGGGGRTGKYLVNQLINKGFQLKVLLRHPEQFQIESQQIEIVQGDATHPESILQLAEGCDAIISVVGQRPGEPMVACRVTQNLLNAMKHFGIPRLISLAGLNVDIPTDRKGKETMMATKWMKANFPEIHADRQESHALLEQSQLDWTLVRVPFIEFQEARGELTVNLEDCPSGKINAGSLAIFLVDQLQDERFIRKAPFAATF